jgi:hypothetical protein
VWQHYGAARRGAARRFSNGQVKQSWRVADRSDMTRLRPIFVAALLICAALPAAAHASRAVFIGDMFHSHTQHPKTLGLWASDGLVKLRWSGWGSRTATATGKVTTHSQGVYRYSPARVIASEIHACNGRWMYTRLRYRAFGRWQEATLEGCQFSGA